MIRIREFEKVTDEHVKYQILTPETRERTRSHGGWVEYDGITYWVSISGAIYSSGRSLTRKERLSVRF